MAEYLSKEDMSTGEYISRDEALKAMQYCCENCDNYNGAMCRACDNADEMDIICDIPAADVQPVKRGRWLEHRAVWIDQPRMEGWFVQAKCSECERLAPVLNRFTKSVVYEYCPHCGARMDGADATKG